MRRRQGEACRPDAADAAARSTAEATRERACRLAHRLAARLPPAAHRRQSRRRRCSSARPRAATCPTALATASAVWGPDAAALCAALAAQLGHRRLHRPARLSSTQWRRARRGPGRRSIRCTRCSRTTPAHASPYSPSSRAQLNIALHRRRGGRRTSTTAEAARRLRALAKLPGAAGRAARAPTGRLCRRRARPSTRCWSCCTRSFRAATCDRASARARLPALRAERGAAAAPARAVRGAAGALPRGRSAASGAGRPGRRATATRRGAQVAALRRASTPSASSYYEYLQWQADAQLEAAAARCARRCGMPLGLYLRPGRLGRPRRLRRLGATGDASRSVPASARRPTTFNPQRPGLGPAAAAARPPARRAATQPFIETLRANMRHAGALRIDHVMGLMRLFWIPPAARRATAPMCTIRCDELLAILALESQRHRCLVIGEDLGTVPDEMREAMRALRRAVVPAAVLRARRTTAASSRPADYPREALVGGQHARPADAGRLVARRATCACAARSSLYPDHEMHASSSCVERAQRARAPAARRCSAQGCCRAAGRRSRSRAAADAARSSKPCTPFWRARRRGVMVVQLEDVLGELRAGQHARHHRRASQLAAQAAASTLEALGRRARRRRSRRTLARSPAASAPAARGARAAAARRARSRAPPTACSSTGLQLRRRGAASLPYLARLGISHVYCSPIQRARPGSMHGYDVVDARRDQSRARRRCRLRALRAALRGARHGPAARHGAQPHGRAGRRQPLVDGRAGERPGLALRRALRHRLAAAAPRAARQGAAAGAGRPLRRRAGARRAAAGLRGGRAASLALRYFDHRFPLDPRTYPARAGARPRLRRADADARRRARAARSTRFAAACRRATPPDAGRAPSAARQAALLKRTLRRARCSGPRSRPALDAAIDGHQRRPAQPRRAARAARAAGLPPRLLARGGRRDQLPALLRHQRAGRAAHGASRRCSRPRTRFVLDLAARGRGRRPAHRPSRRPARPGAVLRAPAGRLCARAPASSAGATDGRAAALRGGREDRSRRTRTCPRDWAVHGTTGYRFANVVNGVLVDAPRARARSTASGARFTGEREQLRGGGLPGQARGHARMRWPPSSTLLADRAARASRRADRRTRDYTLNALRDALARGGGLLPVYRTYIGRARPRRRTGATSTGRSRRRGGAGRRRRPVGVRLRARCCCWATPADGAAAGRGAARCGASPRASSSSARRWRPRAWKTRPSTATCRLVSLNEVGGDPAPSASRSRAFHGASARPRSALAAHDAGHLHARQQALGGRARSHRRAVGDARGAGGWRCGAGTRMTRSTAWTIEGRAAPSRTRRIPALPDAAGHAARPVRWTRRRLRRIASASSATCRRRRARPSCTPAGPRPNEDYEGALDGLRRKAARAAAIPTRSSATCASSPPSVRLVRRPQQPLDWCCSSSPRPACPTSTRATS